ncbi:MAG: hypothetical protein ACP5LB_03425 [Candidatus Bathyarchaeia archaeon]
MLPPINAQKKFPGNIGEGISSDAAVKSKKNAVKIANPLIAIFPFTLYGWVWIGLSSRISNIAIFNKHYCLPAQQKYKTNIPRKSK